MPDLTPDFTTAPAWTALFLGLFSLFAGVGELRNPGQWRKMIDEMVSSPALKIMMAFVELFLGAVVYLANPWASPYWLSKVMSVVGGLMCVEALVTVAFSDIYLTFWARRLAPWSRFWAGFSTALGVALIVAGATGF